MSHQKPLVDMIRDVVNATSCEILEQLKRANTDIRAINYMQGPASEIKSALMEYDKHPTKCFEKYPLIVMITPFTEKPGDVGGYAKAMPKIGIAFHTSSEYDSRDRYQKSFNNILLPLYDEFIYQLVASGYFAARSERDLKISRLIRDDIGRSPFLAIDGMTSDYIDAIELPGIELSYNTPTCLTKDFR